MKKQKDDAAFMKIALDLARKGWGRVSPNPMVGAVVVKDGKVVGKGWHRAVGHAHAEVNAIDDAGKAAEGADIYITLEPCNHTGRTPPCTRKILEAGIRRVIVAMNDPNPDVAGGGNAFLRSKGIAVHTGVCEAEARLLNEVFIKFIKTKRPFVLLKCAATLDGRIAAKTGDARWVTGEKSRRYVHHLRDGYDGIMVGIGTVKADDPSLTARLEKREGSDPTRIILDTSLSIPEKAKVLRIYSQADTLLVTGPNISEQKKMRLKQKGVKVIKAPLKNGMIHLDRLMDRLGYIGITSLLIEGGSRVIDSVLKARIVDKINFFYAPKILGGDDGIPICKGEGPELMRQCIPIRDMKLHSFEEDFMVEGYIDRTRIW